MSDSAQGPGWWIASDGKWYPPDRHHDPDHRSFFDGGASGDVPFVPLGEAVMPIDVGPLLFADPETTSGAATYPDRPPYLPPGVPLPEPSRSPDSPHRRADPPVDWPLYDHPVLPEPEEQPDPNNRLVGLFIVAAALVAVAASLLPWVTFDGGPVGGDSSGWFRGEGKLTLLAGIVLAGAGGAIAAGAKRLWLKLVAMVAAVVIVVVFVVDMVDITVEANDLVEQGIPVDLDQAYGLWMVGIAGITAFVLTLVERTPWSSSAR
ncbi:MAG: hypothetical protein ACR2QE_08920 [Acidimicrobiales bacterium]